ncbi:HpcH/HpaI aldolase/citrate lyase family protein [Arthrobacter sp. SA17]
MPELEPTRTIVRVNPAGTDEFEKDLHCLAHTPYRTVMLAKTENAAQVRALEGFNVIALCETAAGIINAPAIAAEPNVVGLMWVPRTCSRPSAEPQAGTTTAATGPWPCTPRSAVLLAARAYGKEAIDSVYVNIPDLAGLASESRDAVASGFSSKACIHPNQVAVVRDAYAPSEAEVAEANELLEAASSAGSGVFQFKGKMIDGPILKHAEAMVRRSGR